MLMRHLASAKLHEHFDFVALVEKFMNALKLHFQVPDVNRRAELHFLNVDHNLFFLGLGGLLLLLVFKLAVVDEFNNWWLRAW